jgi:hypothetical protein
MLRLADDPSGMNVVVPIWSGLAGEKTTRRCPQASGGAARSSARKGSSFPQDLPPQARAYFRSRSIDPEAKTVRAGLRKRPFAAHQVQHDDMTGAAPEPDRQSTGRGVTASHPFEKRHGLTVLSGHRSQRRQDFHGGAEVRRA